MKQRILCCLLAAILLVMVIPAFAESTTRSRDKNFSATVLKKGYTFKDFAHPVGKQKVEVTVSKLEYANKGYDYFYAYTCDNNGAATSADEKVYLEGKTFTLSTTAQNYTYFNLRVDNALYREKYQSTNNLEVAGTAVAK